jgi:hypothetical protein
MTKHNTIPQDHQNAEICSVSAKNGIMKVEQCTATAALPLVSTFQVAALSRAKIDAHPHVADGNVRTPVTGKEGAAMNDSDDGRESPRIVFEESAKPSVEIDVEKYQALLDDPDLSDTQKEEIMRALWMVMMAFADLGFGVHPAQEVCGKTEQTLDLSGCRDSNDP